MNTPDAAARAFMGAWQKHDWARMHASLQVRRRSRTDRNRLKAQFGFKVVSSWQIAAMQRVSLGHELETPDGSAGAVLPEMVAVGVEVVYRFGRVINRRGILLNVVLEDEHGNPPHEPNVGEWGVNEVSALREFALRG